jgi:hypothetical protein
VNNGVDGPVTGVLHVTRYGEYVPGHIANLLGNMSNEAPAVPEVACFFGAETA